MFAVKGFGFLFPLSFSKTMQERKPLQAKASSKKQIRSRADIDKSKKPARSKDEQEWLDQALMDASKNDNSPEIMRLIKAGADAAKKDKDDWTVLLRSAAKGNTQICELIIDEYRRSGGDANDLIASKEKNNRTALHWAALYGHIPICALLIEEYAKAGGNAKDIISAKDCIGLTPLHLASIKGRTQTCAFLIGEYAKAGGNIKEFINSKDKDDGKTGLDWAEHEGKAQTAQFLKSIESLANILNKEESNAFYSCFAECTSG